jgi:hypothetical protein
MNKPGELTLRGKLNLTDMLRPAVQPGSKIDYEYPPESVTVSFHATSSKTKLKLVTAKGAEFAKDNNDSRATFTVPATGEKLVPIEISLANAGGPMALAVEWTTNEDTRPRPFPLRRLLVPWADTSAMAKDALVATRPPELDGGSWARGYREFFGEKAMCS